MQFRHTPLTYRTTIDAGCTLGALVHADNSPLICTTMPRNVAREGQGQMLHTLTRKVILTGIGFLLLIGIVAAFAIGNILDLQEATTYLTNETLPRVQSLHRIRADLVQALGETDAFLRGGDMKDLDEAQSALAHADASFTGLQTLVGERDDAYDLQSEADLVRVRDQLQTLATRTQQLVQSARASDPTATLTMLDQLADQMPGADTAITDVVGQDARAVTAAIESQIQASMAAVIGLCGLCLLLTALAVGMLQWQIVRPVRALAVATQTVAHGDLQPDIRVTSNDEIGRLQAAFNAMVATIQQQIQGREEQVRVAEAARDDAAAARNEIAHQLSTVEAQRAVINEMSVPILPLTATALVLPLVGVLDSTRLQILQERLLHRLETSAVHHVILDITGVPLVDSQVAQGLIKAIQAARLLGSEVVLVGIRPEVAQAIVNLGIHLDGVITYSTLQSGIAYVLQYDLARPAP
jgi:rsbT co-antagonist protein RsbR